jgi:hypothetical protein
MKQDAELRAKTDPLDTYTREAMSTATASCGTTVATWYSFEGGERLVAMQRVAEISGCAFLDHETHLSIHPTFGPWVAWRAVIVLDMEGVSTSWVRHTKPCNDRFAPLC